MIFKNLQTRILVLISIIIFAYTDSVPIYRHQNKTAQQLKQSNQCGPVGPSNATVLGFGNCFQNIYYINIQIGTPSQTLGVQFDTGSYILWVPTQFVQNVTPIFNTSLSSTFTNTSQVGGVQYVDGSGVSGTYGTDVFKIQGSFINIITQYLWVTQEKMNFPPQIQGLVGMSNVATPANFLDVAYNNGLISSSVFALQILDETQTSVIYYNEIPQQITNQTIFVPVIGQPFWSVSVQQVTVGGIDMTSYAADVAVIDSGTSYFYVNNQLFNAIYNQYFNDCQYFQQQYLVCFCSSTGNWPAFTFTFEGVQVQINPEQYTASLGGNFCTPNFGSISGFSQILLGDIFFRSYTITFDKINQQIGFAGSNLQPISPITSQAEVIIGYIFLAVAALLIVMALFVLCCIESFLSTMMVKPLTLDLKTLELAGTPKLQARFL